MQLGERITLDRFLGADAPEAGADVRTRLSADRVVVDRAAAGDGPVYGLNTGLGANLGHRVAPEDIAAFQRQIIDGRAVATGEPLPPGTGHALTRARLVSAAVGGSGLSLDMFDHLLACAAVGFDPAIPEYGSIGAGDLTQNAVWALAMLGEGRCWQEGALVPADRVLAAAGLMPPVLAPKDAMALLNHGGLTVALAARALGAARQGFDAMRAAVLLSYAGYDANRDVLAPEVNALRPAPGQAACADWLLHRLQGLPHAPRRIQEALSFRTVAPVLGAAQDALIRAIEVWEDEANGLQDSPAVLGGDAMRSTPNFTNPALTLALENLCLSGAMLAAGSVQRMQRMMDPALSGLPRYLAPGEGASAGLVPMQKTAAALGVDIRAMSQPVRFDTAPVSGTVEDFAAETPQAARRLDRQSKLLERLAALEALTAVRAIDLRHDTLPDGPVASLYRAILRDVPGPGPDRPLGDIADRVIAALRGAH